MPENFLHNCGAVSVVFGFDYLARRPSEFTGDYINALAVNAQPEDAPRKSILEEFSKMTRKRRFADATCACYADDAAELRAIAGLPTTLPAFVALQRVR